MIPFCKKLGKFLSTGIVDAEDAKPHDETLEEHDKRYHGGHFDGKSRCEFRENLKKKDKTDNLTKKSEKEGEEKASQQDYQDLADIRASLDPIARLLNGRAGNLQALQSSRRWQALSDYPSNSHEARLRQLLKSDDPAVARSAADLLAVSDAIIGSSKAGWAGKAGIVPAETDLPSQSQSLGAQKHGHRSQAATANAGTPPRGGYTVDDARAILGRVAKSINHHINKGDFTPNANAIAAYQAEKPQIQALKDKQLDQFVSEIDASIASGNKTNISMVPPPSQQWIQAHAPKQMGLAGMLGALLGGMGHGIGGGTSQTPKQQPTKGKFSGQTWTPFSGQSDWNSVLTSINTHHPAVTDPNYFKNQADALTPSQAIADMEKRGDIVKGGYRDSFDNNDPDEAELWAGWSPSKKLSDDTVRCVSVCFEDLRKRFPNMPWKSNLEIRCGTKAMTGGQSTHTADWRRHTVLFNCDYGNIWHGIGLGKSNYGHPDARFPFDVLRHEMGHALISGQLPNGKRMISKWHDAMSVAYGNPAVDLEKFAGRYVSSYAVTRKGNGFSMAECLSECFSLATSPDYTPGYLPPPVEDFIFGEMLGLKKPTSANGNGQ